jgi:Uma2 family endonuclease
MARPNEVHGFLAYNLGRILGNYTYVRGAGFVSGENGLLLHSEPDTAVGPDVMVYLEKRSYDALSRQFSSTMPTLVAEVLSPTDRPSAVLRKVKSYLDRGVRVVAVLSPEECTITLYRSNEFPQMFDETDTLTCPELPEFACPVADVFRLP